MKILDISYDRDIVIQKIEDRWYTIPHAFKVTIVTPGKIYTIRINPGFMFDGRSGGPMIDPFIPNLGTQAELKSWLLHDIMYYAIGFGMTFSVANDVLYWNLRTKCKYAYPKARLIWGAVQLFGKSSYGEPKVGDREYPNLEKILVYSDLY